MITPVILCGGSGTRLWPLSRKSYPKQFTNIIGDTSLFQAAAQRLSAVGFTSPVIVTSDAFRFVVGEQLSAINCPSSEILIEPEGRNTAPAILAAALRLAEQDTNALMLVVPADHIIPDADAFRETVAVAAPTAQSGGIVTFGITPDRPETGYGYLKVSDTVQTDGAPLPLGRFVEKPDAEEAARMLAAGGYLWNAGIFLMSVETCIKAFDRHAPDLMKPVRAAIDGALIDLGFLRLDPAAWAGVSDISVDYAIMEKAENLFVMPYSGRWSDLGSWDAIWSESDPDTQGVVAAERTTAIDCHDTLLRSEVEGLEVVGIGLEDITVVAMPDAVLVAHRSESQRIKDAVATLKAKGAPQATQLPRDYRPWGWYESLSIGDRFQVKRIHVHPSASLSLQSHYHRSEHWIVVEGTARVTIADDVRLVTENQSVYIPLGAVHRMENPGKVPVVLIEVQTGRYLGEDDIVRYEDIYARN